MKKLFRQKFKLKTALRMYGYLSFVFGAIYILFRYLLKVSIVPFPVFWSLGFAGLVCFLITNDLD